MKAQSIQATTTTPVAQTALGSAAGKPDRSRSRLTGLDFAQAMGRTPSAVQPSAGRKLLDMRATYQRLLGDAFTAQNPTKTAADIGLRGALYYDPATQKIVTPASRPDLYVDGALDQAKIADLPAVTWFYEVEAKMTPRAQRNTVGVDPDTFATLHDALTTATGPDGLTRLLGSELGGRLQKRGLELVQHVADGKRAFNDDYYTDGQDTIERRMMTVRVRRKEGQIGTTAGNFQTKIVGEINGALWGRGEVKAPASEMISQEDYVTPGKVPNELNPTYYLQQIAPELRRDALTANVTVADKRHEFIINDPKSDENVFLITLDWVTGIDAKTGDEGEFLEIECERMQASDDPKAAAELEQLSTYLMNKFDLVPSTMNKAGAAVTAIARARDAKSQAGQRAA